MTILDGFFTINALGGLLWMRDEFGNSVAPFFTSKDAAKQFLAAYSEAKGLNLDRATIEQNPLLDALEYVSASIERKAAFFALNPKDINSFDAKSAHEFLFSLIMQSFIDGQHDYARQIGRHLS